MMQTSGFSFGGTPAFGQPAQTQQPQTNQFSFGQPAQPQQTSQFSFGQPQQQQPAPNQFSFGQPQQQQQQPAANQFSFGQPTQPQQQQQSAFSFGQPAQAQQQPAGGAFAFGQPTQQQVQPAAPFSFGQPAQPQQQQQQPLSQFSFGQPQQQAQQPANQFSFGQPVQQQQAQQPANQFSFGQPAQQQQTQQPVNQFSFGQPIQQQQPQQPATNFSFGQPVQQQQQPAAAPFSFGTPVQQPQPAALGTGFSFGTPNQQQQQTGFGFGGPQIGLTQQAPAVAPAPFTGLGGTPGSSNPADPLSSSSITGTRPENRATKELPLPTELVGLLDDLKAHMKTEKIKMAEVSRANYKTVQHVSNGLDEARMLLISVSNLIQRQTHSCEAFRIQINQDMKNAEMAQLTRETPIALQPEHHVPTEYFYKLVKDYESRMASYSREIKKAETALTSIGGSPGVTAQDLCVALKSSKDTLVVLAAKVKSFHEQVTSEIETHKNLLRFVHGDSAKDIFAARSRAAARDHEWKVKGAGEAVNGSVLFPNRITDPTNMYMTYMSGSRNAPVGGVLHAPYARSTTLIPNRTYDQSSYNTTSYGSPTFFQPPSNPIFNPHNATSPPPSSGISLKRSKH